MSSGEILFEFASYLLKILEKSFVIGVHNTALYDSVDFTSGTLILL